MNLPNSITFSRLLGLPFIIYLLANPNENNRWLALTIFLVAASTDWLDGYLARKLDQITDLGKFLDPLVDKLLVLGPLLSLIELNQLPAWGVFLILSRELGIAGWRVNSSGNGKIPGANLLGKIKTVTQIIAIALLISPLAEPWSKVGIIAFWVAVGVTIISGLVYVWAQPAAKISSSTEKSISPSLRREAK